MNENDIPRAAATFQTSVRVRSYHLDSFGHVNNAVYLNYLEAARCDWLEARGILFQQFAAAGQFPVVVRAELDFRAAAACHDQLIIHVRIDSWRSRTFSMRYKLTRGSDGPVVLDALTVHVFVDAAGKPISIPSWFINAFADTAAPEEPSAGSGPAAP